MSLDQRLEIRLSAAERQDWETEAEFAGTTLAAWIRRACAEAADLARAVRRADADAERRARRLHELDPSSARQILERRDPPYQGGSRA
jgi:hypothetical protein